MALDRCPVCDKDFNNKDIYQHFLKEYTDNWPYKYKKNLDQILESIRKYPDLYNKERVPSEEKIRSLNEIELNAWWSACSYGWTFENPKCFRSEIGIEDPEFYDGVALWQCPDCGYTWKRFPWISDEMVKQYQNKPVMAEN